MKHILVITPFFAPHVGGSQQYMEDLYATLLKQHHDMPVSVLCYNTDNAPREEEYRGMHIFRIPSVTILPGQFVLPNPFLLLDFLYRQRNSFDVLHVSTRFFETAWWAPVYAKLIHRKILLTDHCAFHPVHPNRLIRGLAKYIDLLVIPPILKLYTNIFSTNIATQTFLQHSLRTQSDVLYGGVDLERFNSPKNTSTHKRLTITYSGRIIESKGVTYLFNFAKKHPEFDIVFAGPGPLVEQFKKEINTEHISHIKIVGSLSKDAVISLLSNTDIFVHPSYHHEGFPNSLLEAGAMGLPVIATDVGGTREIIQHMVSGVLIEPKNSEQLEQAILMLGEDKALREKLAKNLSAYVKKQFSWEHIAETHYTYLKSM